MKKDEKEVEKFELEISEDEDKPNLKGDYANILILFFLYVLQGKSR